MTIDGKQMILEIAGLGILFHSPKSAEHIQRGEDYLWSNYMTAAQVQSHIQAGTLVSFGTGTPGTFILHFHSGYPDEKTITESDFKYRLGLRCTDNQVYFRDLYDLLAWDPDCEPDRILPLPDGIYHVTLCSNTPRSGILGDHQTIDFYLQKLGAFPRLRNEGILHLCG